MIFWTLEAVLLFVLAIPIVMTYRIFPIAGTPYWLFTLLFILLGVNAAASLVFATKKIRGSVPVLLFWLITAIAVLGPMVTAIVDRAKTAPVYGVHDIILQQEAAMRFLLEGKNPYKETYFETPLAQWHYDELGESAVNPALYHFVMPPWYLLFPFIFYFVSIPVLGYFDGRMAVIFLLGILLVSVYRWYKDRHIGLVAMTGIAMSPGVIDYMIEGRSDIFALAWLVPALLLLERRRYVFSALLFGLSLMSKQTVWFAIPFYCAYLWYSTKKNGRLTGGALFVVAVVVATLAGPFLLWDGQAFLNSTIWYLSGNTANSYPVSGYGLGMLLYGAGAIKNIHDTYPFAVWQALLGIPVLFVTLRWLQKKPSMARLLLGYTVFLGVVWWASRYFNNSHLGFLGSLLVLGITKYWDEERLT